MWLLGVDGVRLAVLGTDSVVFVLFAGMLRQQARFVFACAPLLTVRTWIARCLPFLIGWALAVAALLPSADAN